VTGLLGIAAVRLAECAIEKHDEGWTNMVAGLILLYYPVCLVGWMLVALLSDLAYIFLSILVGYNTVLLLFLPIRFRRITERIVPFWFTVPSIVLGFTLPLLLFLL
jgi:hypothetical protein